MLDILDAAADWQRAGTRIAVAVTVTTSSSAPLPVGSWMIIAETGAVLGSVSGGCVEGDVIEQAQLVLADGVPRLQRYGVSDADALAVGLTCGGTIEVLVSAIDAHALDLDDVRAAVADRRPVAIAFPLPSVGTVEEPGSTPVGTVEEPGSTPVGPVEEAAATPVGIVEEAAATPVGIVEESAPTPVGIVDGPDPKSAAHRQLAGLAGEQLRQGSSGVVQFPGTHSGTDRRVFLQVVGPQPRMFVFGVSSFAVATTRLGRLLGFHVTVCDPRVALLTRERFPDAHELVTQWPHRFLDDVSLDRHTVVCVLAHDAKYDLPVLERALASDAGYVGAIGSRRTDVERRRQLRERGVSEQHLAKLRSPIGLDLGGRTAQEVAVSICAEIVMLREGREARPLSATDSARSAQRPSGAEQGHDQREA